MRVLKGTIQTGRFTIPYRLYDNAGPRIICLNGVQQSMAMWQTFVHRFGDTYAITIFDFPNQGKGEIISGSHSVSLDEQIEILDAVIKKTFPHGHLIMCSASWGGVVAAAYAVRHPARVKTLVLASLGTRPNKNMVETIRRGALIAGENRREMAETLIKSFGGNLPDAMKNRIIGQFERMSQESLRAFYEHGLFVISTKEINKAVNVGAIACRTILLNGEKDTIIDLEDVKYLAAQIPHAELRIIKDVGHFLHLEKEEMLDVYENILDSCK
ncbi:MAG: alpha/beta hydrolase [Candidatus Omnitrophota bacterium]|nr:alpha/beta hydrolase [Candidatus Omnitrophota bacterium]